MSFRRVLVDVAWNVMVASTSESGDLDQMRRPDPHRSHALSQSQQIRRLLSARSSKYTSHTVLSSYWSVASTANPLPAELG